MQTTIPETLNRRIFCAILGIQALLLFVLPRTHPSPLVWALALAPMIWLTIVHWNLIHEAIHKLLFTDTPQNELGGRALAIALGTSFHVLRFGHLMHHQHNRHFHSERMEQRSLSALSYYYVNLLIGVYLSELVSGWLLMLLPRRWFMALAHRTFLRHNPEVADAGERYFYVRGNIAQTRTDTLLALVLYAIAFAAAGTQWVWIVALLCVRALMISLMDNIYHFGTPHDNSKAAKELALPPAFSRLILHGNYHETHHLNPAISWRDLPHIHHAQNRHFDGEFFDHGLMQFFPN